RPVRYLFYSRSRSFRSGSGWHLRTRGDCDQPCDGISRQDSGWRRLELGRRRFDLLLRGGRAQSGPPLDCGSRAFDRSPRCLGRDLPAASPPLSRSTLVIPSQDPRPLPESRRGFFCHPHGLDGPRAVPKLPRMSEFVYQDPFPLGPDTTEYECLTTDYVSVSEFEGQPILKIAPEGLALLANEAMKAVNFTLRPSHLAQVAAILDDPEATENDRMVALMLLKNAEIAAKGILPACQDTGTATIVAKKGQRVWTGCNDAEWLSKGIHKTYQEENLRYSQTAPLTMYDEANTKTNLPAQIDLYA